MSDLETARQLVYEEAGDSPPLNEALAYMDAAIAVESAASELLAALEIARDALYPSDRPGISMREWNQRMYKASTPIHNAIAKAKGQS